MSGDTGLGGRKMDKRGNEVKGTDIVTIICMVVFTVCLAVLLANVPLSDT